MWMPKTMDTHVQVSNLVIFSCTDFAFADVGNFDIMPKYRRLIECTAFEVTIIKKDKDYSCCYPYFAHLYGWLHLFACSILPLLSIIQ